MRSLAFGALQVGPIHLDTLSDYLDTLSKSRYPNQPHDAFLITTPEAWVPAVGDAAHGFPYLSGVGRHVGMSPTEWTAKMRAK
jgi:2-polyprenyl-6-methoxyphenol hydroxylase-like FAD-dependent oxidoreductase